MTLIMQWGYKFSHVTSAKLYKIVTLFDHFQLS